MPLGAVSAQSALSDYWRPSASRIGDVRGGYPRLITSWVESDAVRYPVPEGFFADLLAQTLRLQAQLAKPGAGSLKAGGLVHTSCLDEHAGVRPLGRGHSNSTSTAFIFDKITGHFKKDEEPAAAPPPPQQGGYQGGYQAGYPPPQQGGYPPPQQGGYPPPQQGAYPPPQGYPPPPGGGYPPPPGPGGYPPPPGPGGYPPPPPGQHGGYPPPGQPGYPPPDQHGHGPPPNEAPERGEKEADEEVEQEKGDKEDGEAGLDASESKAGKGSIRAALTAGVATPLTLAVGGAAIYFMFCKGSPSTDLGGDSGSDIEDSDAETEDSDDSK